LFWYVSGFSKFSILFNLLAMFIVKETKPGEASIGRMIGKKGKQSLSRL
jgi:hypothetical protein